ncbi:hypothetical protein C6501_16270 [Candidatus Poribacteria bacterium]|nr:MAG: hypothetical protein C6501_16270 [Candidatus Poribacteria bacterium]
MIFTKSNLLYVFYIAIGVFVLWVFMFGKTRDSNPPNSDIEIIRHLNSPSGEYDYYIKNPKFQFLDSEGNVKVMEVLGLYVKIGSPVEITCKVESVDKSFKPN